MREDQSAAAPSRRGALGALAGAFLPAPSAAQADWVKRSNDLARVLLDVRARFSPESAASLGVSGLDEAVTDFSEEARQRSQGALKEAIARLERAGRTESHPLVRQDLEILIDAGRRLLRTQELSDRYLLPYIDVARTVFFGLRALLDDQQPPASRQAALVRLRRYAGTAEGYRPAAEAAAERLRAALKKPSLLGPFQGQLAADFASAGTLLNGLAPLFRKYGLDGFEPALDKLRAQVEAYQAFLKTELAPRARPGFRLPEEIYQLALEQHGVDLPPRELSRQAREAFAGIQKQMEDLAPKVAAAQGWTTSGYRQLIRELKKDQLGGDAILPHYQQRLKQLEAIVRREKLVTLPAREARIRLASAAESAAQPAPHMRPPRLLGNTGEVGEFVLPLNSPDASGTMQAYDDFTFAAASWTLTAHEARPGHELQFARLVENGVTAARAIFAFNSTNVEGWALYAEWLMQPFLPPDGQLICLQHRLMRAARAWLDPDLQAGIVTPEQARAVLRDDVVLSEAMVRQEVDRYTFRAPGQATSYFYGYTRLLELRRDVEAWMGATFDALAFHDFVLRQGLITPAMLRRAVANEFVRRD